MGAGNGPGNGGRMVRGHGPGLLDSALPDPLGTGDRARAGKAVTGNIPTPPVGGQGDLTGFNAPPTVDPGLTGGTPDFTTLLQGLFGNQRKQSGVISK